MSRISLIPLAAMLGLLMTLPALAVEVDKSVAPHPVIDQIFAKYEKAFNAGDAAAIGALWKTDGEFIDPAGDKIVGREAIEKLFKEFFSRTPGEKLSIKILSIKEAEQGRVAVAEIVADVTPPLPGQLGANKTTIVLVRSGDSWLIEGVRERLGMPAAYEHLKVLDWLVGSWSTEAPAGAKPNETSQTSINSTCQWTANKSFLTRTFSTHLQALDLHGTEVIGWDPKAKQIRSWSFESTGGFTESTWKPDGEKWIIDIKGVLADGETVDSQAVLTKIDDNSLSIQPKKRIRDGKPLPELAPMVLRRVNAPTPTPQL
jgi:uncharacterized protein (TIGR02246 family)